MLVFRSITIDSILVRYVVPSEESNDYFKWVYNPSLIRGLLYHMHESMSYLPKLYLISGKAIGLHIVSTHYGILISDGRLQESIGDPITWEGLHSAMIKKVDMSGATLSDSFIRSIYSSITRTDDRLLNLIWDICLPILDCQSPDSHMVISSDIKRLTNKEILLDSSVLGEYIHDI